MLSFRKTETVTKAVKQKDMNMIMKKWAMAAAGSTIEQVIAAYKRSQATN